MILNLFWVVYKLDVYSFIDNKFLSVFITIGNTLNDDDQQFTGYMSCMQIFPGFLSEEEMDKIWTLCRQEYWKMRPKGNVI